MRIFKNIVMLLSLGLVWSSARAEDDDTDPSLSAYDNPESALLPRHREVRQKKDPLWVNPCQYPPGHFDMLVATKDKKLPDNRKYLMEISITQAKVALTYAKNFRNEFAEFYFKLTFEELNQLWKHTCYSWLPSIQNIPKRLGEPLGEYYLTGIENDFNTTLANCFAYLQAYAVGMEQVTLDQKIEWKSTSPEQRMKQKFAHVEYQLRDVLCELEALIFEYYIDRHADVSRDIFDKNLTNLSEQYTAIRNWLIFRDYMNCLEYIIEVFEFFYAKIPDPVNRPYDF